MGNHYVHQKLSLREKCPNTELFLVRIQSEYRKIRTRNSSKYFDTFDTLLTQLRLLNLMQSKMFCHSQPFKRQFHKMVKHTQTIGRQQGLAQNGLNSCHVNIQFIMEKDQNNQIKCLFICNLEAIWNAI